jgi:hypothetical protein
LEVLRAAAIWPGLFSSLTGSVGLASICFCLKRVSGLRFSEYQKLGSVAPPVPRRGFNIYPQFYLLVVLTLGGGANRRRSDAPGLQPASSTPGPRSAAWLGRISYAFYRCHTPVLCSWTAGSKDAPSWMGADALAFCLTIWAAYFTTRLVEQPLMRLWDRWFPARASAGFCAAKRHPPPLLPRSSPEPVVTGYPEEVSFGRVREINGK